MIEVKRRDPSISPGIKYFHEKYQIPALQLVKELKNERIEKGIEVRKGIHFLKTLNL
jgi:hypothetical protein